MTEKPEPPAAGGVPAGDHRGASEKAPSPSSAWFIAIPDAALSVALYIVAAIVVWGVWGLDFWRDTTPGPAFLPLMMAALISVCATWLIIRRGQPSTVSAPELRAAGIYLGLLVVSAAIFMWAGALVTIALFVFAELKLLQRRTYLYAAITGIAASVGVWLVFVVALRVRLPLGFLASLYY